VRRTTSSVPPGRAGQTENSHSTCRRGDVEVGTRFGLLTVIRNIRRYGRFNYRVLCQCNCGALNKVSRFELLNGGCRSCGCFQRSDLARRSKNNSHGVTHGATKADASAALTRTYSSWKAMIQRTTNPKANGGRDWHRYGGATPPVEICKRWLQFSNFLADLGRRKSGTTLGRFKDTGDYKSGNCVWQSNAEQAAEHKRAHVQ
jgi:hypothetical protein